MSDLKIIVLRETLAQSIISDAITYGSLIALIGIGVVLQSDAMQWVGAIMAFLSIIGRLNGKAKRMTLAEAKSYLATIEEQPK